MLRYDFTLRCYATILRYDVTLRCYATILLYWVRSSSARFREEYELELTNVEISNAFLQINTFSKCLLILIKIPPQYQRL